MPVVSPLIGGCRLPFHSAFLEIHTFVFAWYLFLVSKFAFSLLTDVLPLEII